jgi:phosphoglycerate dehydrogenase-like enzyme
LETIRIVVWDDIGNVLLGVRPWDSWAPRMRERLLAADPNAQAHTPDFAQLFAGYDVHLTWLYGTDQPPAGFRTELFPLFTPHVRRVRSSDDVRAAVADADFVVLHKERLAPDVLRAARHVRLLQHLGQDSRGVPLAVARELGIPVAAVPLTNYLVVAEHTWGLILNHLRRLPQQRAAMQSRSYAWGTASGVQMARGLSLGLLGLGEIARPVARIARAFDMRVIYWDIERFPEFEASHGVTFAEWEDVFRQADVLSVHLALNQQTTGIIGARHINLMKPGALFVNTARGRLIDQDALVAAIRQRRIGGAALEVFATEPLPPDDPLHALHEDLSYSVTLTPHSASQAPWTWIWDSQAVWDNVLHALRGEQVEHLV